LFGINGVIEFRQRFALITSFGLEAIHAPDAIDGVSQDSDGLDLRLNFFFSSISLSLSFTPSKDLSMAHNNS
jgi:hypothetical protein